MRIKALIQTITFLLLLWGGMISCTSEEPYNTPEDLFKDGSVPLDIPVTKSVNDRGDKYVETVRLIIVKNSKVANNRLINVPVSQTDVSFTEKVPLGTVDYFLIANELPAWDLGALNVNDVVFTNTLKEKILPFSAYPVVNTAADFIPMLQYYEGLVIKDEGLSGNGRAYYNSTEVTSVLGTIDRLYAKTSLELKCTFADNAGEPIELESVSVKRMPKESYLVPDFYYNTAVGDFFNGDTTGVISSSNYTLTTTGFTGDFSFYIPEHVVADTANRTYLSAVVRLVHDPGIKREYKIALGDSIDRTDLGAMHILTYMNEYAGYKALRVSRNTHYDITATIKSFEETSGSDMEIIAEIIDWNEGGTTPVDPDRYFLNLSQSDFKLASTAAYEGMVTVATDYSGGWSVSGFSAGVTIVETTAGKLVFRIADPSAASSWTIDITAGKVTKQIKITR